MTHVVNEFQTFDIDVVTQLLMPAQVEDHQVVRFPAVVLIQLRRPLTVDDNQLTRPAHVELNQFTIILVILLTKLVIKITVLRIHAWIVFFTGSIM